MVQKKITLFKKGLQMLFFTKIISYSPVSAIFWSPGNRTIWKTAQIEHWFSTKISILDFWILKVSFFFAYFNDFNQQKTTLLNHLQFVFFVTVLRLINQLDSWKIIVYFCRKKDTIRKNGKTFKNFEKKISEKNWNSFKNL